MVNEECRMFKFPIWNSVFTLVILSMVDISFICLSETKKYSRYIYLTYNNNLFKMLRNNLQCGKNYLDYKSIYYIIVYILG